jgi:hypothetical protein
LLVELIIRWHFSGFKEKFNLKFLPEALISLWSPGKKSSALGSRAVE